jgi:hypothetical protein
MDATGTGQSGRGILWLNRKTLARSQRSRSTSSGASRLEGVLDHGEEIPGLLSPDLEIDADPATLETTSGEAHS